MLKYLDPTEQSLLGDSCQRKPCITLAFRCCDNTEMNLILISAEGKSRTLNFRPCILFVIVSCRILPDCILTVLYRSYILLEHLFPFWYLYPSRGQQKKFWKKNKSICNRKIFYKLKLVRSRSSVFEFIKFIELDLDIWIPTVFNGI